MPCKEAVVYFIFKGHPRERSVEHTGSPSVFFFLRLQEILKVASTSTVKEEGISLYRAGLSRHSPRELTA